MEVPDWINDENFGEEEEEFTHEDSLVFGSQVVVLDDENGKKRTDTAVPFGSDAHY
jgi:hypothetical protein